MRAKLAIIFLLLLSGIAGFSVSLYFHENNNLLFLNGQENREAIYHYPISFTQQLKSDKQAGEKIYKEYCAACHAAEPLIDVNSPRINNTAIWRYKNKIGINQLLQHTMNGVGAMPARGGCFECSDAQLRQAVEYMVKKGVSNK